MDMGTLVILKLPEWLVSTDGWGLMLPHNDVPALFKVTAFCCGGLQPVGVQGKYNSTTLYPNTRSAAVTV